MSTYSVLSNQYKGNNGYKIPDPGYIGEVLIASVLVANTVSLTTTAISNITSLLITPGIWMVYGSGVFVSATSGQSVQSLGINATTATMTLLNTDFNTTTATFGVGSSSQQTPIQYFAITLPTTYYLNARATFGDACTAYGYMRAVRIA